jgi:hypothetical protein
VTGELDRASAELAALLAGAPGNSALAGLLRLIAPLADDYARP